MLSLNDSENVCICLFMKVVYIVNYNGEFYIFIKMVLNNCLFF